MSSFKILAMYKQYLGTLVADNVNIIDCSVKVIDSAFKLSDLVALENT